MSEKPNVIIFGGTYGMADVALRYLVPSDSAEARVAHVRLVDKPSLSSPATFIGKDLLALIEKRNDVIEYRQADLADANAVAQSLEEAAPNGQPYTHVLDFSGHPAFYQPASVHINQTFNVAMNIAREAQRRGVKAIVRLQPPWYEHLNPTANYTEKDPNGWKPMGTNGVWWHETLRAMGNIPGLPFCVVRCAYAYGPGLFRTEAATAIVQGFTYKTAGRELTVYSPPNLRKNTIHTEDLAQAIWRVAEWMANTGRESANSIAGVELPPTNDAEVPSAPGTVPSGGVIVPVFNAVDDTNTTQQIMSQEIGKAFEISVSFSKSDSPPDGLGDQESQEWARSINSSTPPASNSPLSPVNPAYHSKAHGCALDGSRLREVVSFRPIHPSFNATSINTWVQWCKQQGIWPNV